MWGINNGFVQNEISSENKSNILLARLTKASLLPWSRSNPFTFHDNADASFSFDCPRCRRCLLRLLIRWSEYWFRFGSLLQKWREWKLIKIWIFASKMAGRQEGGLKWTVHSGGIEIDGTQTARAKTVYGVSNYDAHVLKTWITNE